MDTAHLKVRTILHRNGLQINDHEFAALSRYVELLSDWNSKINLISRSDMENIWTNHILHSLSIMLFVELPAKSRILDLGTGGGLPGVPLAIMRQDCTVTLLDSIQKKTRALADLVDQLGLTNACVVNGRAEELGPQKEFTRNYDVIVSRAVAPLINLIKWSKPFLRNDTSKRYDSEKPKAAKFSAPFMVTLKGGDLTDEIAAAKVKHNPQNIHQLDLIFDGSEEMGLQEKKIIVVQF